MIFEIRDLEIFIRDSKSREPLRDFESRDPFLISRLEISRFFSHLEINLEKPFSRLPLYLEINFPFRSEKFHYSRSLFLIPRLEISRFLYHLEINLEKPSRDAKSLYRKSRHKKIRFVSGSNSPSRDSGSRYKKKFSRF